MKIKILFFTSILFFVHTRSFAQLMTFGFVKNCMSYKRKTVTDELTKKHFFIVDKKVEDSDEDILEGCTYYSNEKEPANPGEIRVRSLIEPKKKITEISFIKGLKNDYTNNYIDVYKQMVSFFNNGNTFKSNKFKTDVNVFVKNGIYYYAYTKYESAYILISDRDLEKIYF
ncbi:MAG: hypothetical protein ABI315_04045 [Bacteroidia bacterium]